MGFKILFLFLMENGKHIALTIASIPINIKTKTMVKAPAKAIALAETTSPVTLSVLFFDCSTASLIIFQETGKNTTKIVMQAMRNSPKNTVETILFLFIIPPLIKNP